VQHHRNIRGIQQSVSIQIAARACAHASSLNTLKIGLQICLIPDSIVIYIAMDSCSLANAVTISAGSPENLTLTINIRIAFLYDTCKPPSAAVLTQLKAKLAPVVIKV
jgi:hypothetical protein